MYVEYYKIPDKKTFRFELLKKIIGNEEDVTIILDTNQQTEKKSGAEIEDLLKRFNISYLIKSTEPNELTILGLFIRRKKKKFEKLFILQISPVEFTRELFDACLGNFDIAIGLGKIKSLGEICDSLFLDYDEVLFNRAFFRESIYDSILCASLRCSFDITGHIETIG
jgi:hypothetical protein